MNEQTVLKGTDKMRAVFRRVPVILWAMILLILVLGFVSPNSVRPAHMMDFTRQAAPMIIVAVGQTLVLLIGGLDLSVGAVMVLVDVMAAQLMANDPAQALPIAALCIGVGALVGLINGLMCTLLKMPPFVVTLGMSTLLLGVTLLFCGGAPKGSIPDNFRFLGTGFVGKIPAAALIWATVAVIMIIVIRYLPLGKYIIATGVNSMAVYQSGISRIGVQLVCYILCGALSAAAGLQIAAYIGTGSLVLGDNYQMQSIAAALLGGAAFSGGKGSIFGTAVAGLFIVIMYSLIAVLNMDAGDQKIIQGLIILIGVFLNTGKKAG